MDMLLSADQQRKRDEMRAFVQDAIVPAAAQIDATGRVPLVIVRKAAKLGYMAPTVPSEYGGAGYDMLTFTLLVEEIARGSLSLAIPFAIHTCLATGCILDAGSEEQKRRFLPRLTRRGDVASFALTEPEAGSDAGAMRTWATPVAGGFRIDGLKTWVSNGGLAAVFVVFAKLAGTGKHEGINAFIVEKHAAGLTLVDRERTLGLRGADIRTVRFDGVIVPEHNRLGDIGSGWGIVMRAFNRVRVALAAAGLGAAERALELGVQFAAGRQAFGTLLANKQRIQNYVAESAVDIASLRHTIWHAAWLADTGHDYGVPANIVKFLGGRVARDTADRMLQVHGGAGYRDDAEIARIYRDVRALRLLGGTDEIQQFAIARDAFRHSGVKIEP